MFDKIIPYEENLFFLINHAHTAFLDNVMWLYSGTKIWIPVALLIIINIIYKKNRKEWLPVLLAIIVLFTLCDQFSSHIIKPLVARPRPTNYPGIMDNVLTVFGNRSGGYGFTSGHATNSFGFAMFTALLFRNRFYSVFIFLWATVMAYSRLYLGVHFISDVVGGLLSGMLIGYLVYELYLFSRKKFIIRETREERVHPYSTKQINRMTWVIIGYISVWIVLSGILIWYLK